MIKFLKKYHKWLGIVVSIFLLVFSISGIVLNHRALFSSADVSRSWMPSEYEYKNWNNASVRSAINISPDSVLVYGNIGIWLTNSDLKNFSDFSKGFPSGIDNKKICKIFKDSKGRIFAGSLFGLYQLNANKWQKVKLPEVHNPRIVDIIEKGDKLWLLTRSEVIETKNFKDFNVFEIPAPENYNHKIGLFKTLWLIHSGEVYGIIGKILVDLVGLIFIFLTLTGIFYFFNGRRLKKGNLKNPQAIKTRNKFYLKWHNKIGWTTFVFLLITTITGMFLRPPLLIPIAEAKVDKLPFTLLDTPNAWFDQLRRIHFDEAKNRITIATIEGLFYSDDNFKSPLKKFESQPPVSVMGVNAFEQLSNDVFLVGGFNGLFLWNTESGKVMDYIEGVPYIKPKRMGSPIGKHLIAGYYRNPKGKELIFDFDKGILNKNLIAPMPTNVISASPMSLWNVAVEYHTGRIYKIFFGLLYILVVPIVGLMSVFILFSGLIVWWKRFR
jgi:hypothetical protein